MVAFCMDLSVVSNKNIFIWLEGFWHIYDIKKLYPIVFISIRYELALALLLIPRFNMHYLSLVLLVVCIESEQTHPPSEIKICAMWWESVEHQKIWRSENKGDSDPLFWLGSHCCLCHYIWARHASILWMSMGLVSN